MAEIRPFCGLRYNAGIVDNLSDVICAPYDVITPEAQAGYYDRSEYNAVRLELGYQGPGDTPEENRYTRARQQLRDWLNLGVLAYDDGPSMYVHEETFSYDGSRHSRRGIIAAVRLHEWSEGVVIPHEYTLPKPKADRLDLLRACRASFSQVLALYEDRSKILAGLIDDRVCRRAPESSVELDHGAIAAAAEEHRLWRVHEPEILRSMQAVLADSTILMADGHHRYETALHYRNETRDPNAPALRPADHVMMLLVEMNDPGLTILPTHRLVRKPENSNWEGIVNRISEHFQVETLQVAGDLPDRLAELLDLMARRGTRRTVLAALGLEPGKIHLLEPRTVSSLSPDVATDQDIFSGLDVVVLHDRLLAGVLGIGPKQVADAACLSYTRDAVEAAKAVDSGAWDAAFLLNPTRVDQIRDTALAGFRMPQKSTYFYPKPPTGIVMYSHERAW